MADTACDAFLNIDNNIATEMCERFLKERGPSLELCLTYADSLANSGKLREALDVYSYCYKLGSVTPEKLRFLVSAIIDFVMTYAKTSTTKLKCDPLSCIICGGVFYQPVTLDCGHTCCRMCLVRDTSDNCRKCGLRFVRSGNNWETNVLVQSVVEKWWPTEMLATKLRNEGNALFQRNEAHAAIAKYTEALQLVPNDHRILGNRSHALLTLGRAEEGLLDAETAVRVRPEWGKGYYRKGVALLMLGRHEDALLALCQCAALEGNLQLNKHEIARALHGILNPVVRTRHNMMERGPTGPHSYRRYLCSSSHPTIGSSDCEDSSSGEEDSAQHPPRNVVSPVVTVMFQENIKAHSLLERVHAEVEKVRRSEPKTVEHPVAPSKIDSGDFDCVLCSRLLWQPVTTPCGHTYCLMCLERILDYNPTCPLCKTSLADALQSSTRYTTEFVETVIRMFLPSEHASRQLVHCQELADLVAPGAEQEPVIPIFVCIVAYPHVSCPLYVYEPRYRLMIRRLIESEVRTFGMCLSRGRDGGTQRYVDCGTVLEIRDWLVKSDGCSIISTVGTRRFKVLSRGERDGYDVAKIQYIQDALPKPDEMQGLRDIHDKMRRSFEHWFNQLIPSFKQEILSSYGPMPQVENDWFQLPDGPAWVWWLISILPFSPELRCMFLLTTSFEKRLRALERGFNEMQKKKLFQNISSEPISVTSTMTPARPLENT